MLWSSRAAAVRTSQFRCYAKEPLAARVCDAPSGSRELTQTRTQADRKVYGHVKSNLFEYNVITIMQQFS